MRTLQWDRLEERRSVAYVRQVAPTVQVDQHRLVRAGELHVAQHGVGLVAQADQQAGEHLGQLEAGPAAAAPLPALQQRLGVDRRDRTRRMRPAAQD